MLVVGGRADGEVEPRRDLAAEQADLPVPRDEPGLAGRAVAAHGRAERADDRLQLAPRPRRPRRRRRRPPRRARTRATGCAARRAARAARPRRARRRGPSRPTRSRCGSTGSNIRVRTVASCGVVAPMITETMLPPYAGLNWIRRPARSMPRSTQSPVIPSSELARDPRAVVAAVRGRGDQQRVRPLALDDVADRRRPGARGRSPRARRRRGSRRARRRGGPRRCVAASTPWPTTSATFRPPSLPASSRPFASSSSPTRAAPSPRASTTLQQS